MRQKTVRRTCTLAFHLIAFSMSSLSFAQETKPQEFVGTWVLKLGERNLFVLQVQAAGSGVTGSIQRPAKLSSINGAYANMRGGVRHDPITAAAIKDGALHITVQNANNPKDQDKFAMAVNGRAASLAWDDLPEDVIVPPRLFELASSGAKVATDWEPNRLYTATDQETPSAEMKAIYTEDQRVRTEPSTDWKVVNKTDGERREQTKKLLASGALHTGKDYEEASFVFQHGDSPDDYLLAHTLAMVAVSKGDATAIWIASATLDRYLEKIGQKQVFGTQYSSDAQHRWTQEPYDRELVSDALRRQLAVPDQSEQAKQLKAYENQK